MAIDFTQSRDKYPDRCKYVKGVYVDKIFKILCNFDYTFNINSWSNINKKS